MLGRRLKGSTLGLVRPILMCFSALWPVVNLEKIYLWKVIEFLLGGQGILILSWSGNPGSTLWPMSQNGPPESILPSGRKKTLRCGQKRQSSMIYSGSERIKLGTVEPIKEAAVCRAPTGGLRQMKIIQNIKHILKKNWNELKWETTIIILKKKNPEFIKACHGPCTKLSLT